MSTNVEELQELLQQQQNENPLMAEDNVFTTVEAASEGSCPRDSNGRCKACERKGLPILPMRRGTTANILTDPTWKYDNSGFDRSPSRDAATLLPLIEAVEKAAPQRRVLREGYLYVALQNRNKPGLEKVVQAYQVTEQGYFRRFNPYNMRRGRPASLPEKCTSADHDIPAAFITVDDVKFDRAWLAFADDCWPAEVIDRYVKGDAEVFKKRFLELDIDALKRGENETAHGGMLRPDDIVFLNQVLEYAQLEEDKIFSLFKPYLRNSPHKKEALKGYINATVASYAKAPNPVVGIAAVVVPDPVGEVLETNYLRNALVLDKKLWASDNERAYKYATTVEIAKIREAQINEEKRANAAYIVRRKALSLPDADAPGMVEGEIGAQLSLWWNSEEKVRENWTHHVRNNRELSQYETFDDAVTAYAAKEQIQPKTIQEMDARAGEYYSVERRRTFNMAYAQWSNRFSQVINQITQTYVEAMRAEAFGLVMDKDYTDDSGTKADNRVSATFFSRLAARCMDGGTSDLALYDVAQNNLSLGPLVYKERQAMPSTLLWQELLDGYDSLFGKALFRRTPQIKAILQQGVQAERSAQLQYEGLLNTMAGKSFSEGQRAQLDAAAKDALLDQYKAMRDAVASIGDVRDKASDWQENRTLQRVRKALSVSASAAMAELETINEPKARQVMLDQANKQAAQKATAAEQARQDAEAKAQAAQRAQAEADAKVQEAQTARNNAQGNAAELAQEAQNKQEQANRARDAANAAKGEAAKAESARLEAEHAQTAARERLQAAQAREQEAQRALDRAGRTPPPLAEDPKPPRTRRATDMLRYSALLYENKAVTEAIVITNTEDLKEVYKDLEEFLLHIHESSGADMPVKGRRWWRLTQSLDIKWRFFTEVSIPARYLPEGFEQLSREQRTSAIAQAVDAYKADAGSNDFAASSRPSSGNADAGPARRHRRTLLRMLAPQAYEMFYSDNGANDATGAQEAQNTQAQARAEAQKAQNAVDEAERKAAAARQEAARRAQAARDASENSRISEAQKEAAFRRAQESADELARQEAELAQARETAAARAADAKRAEAQVNARTQSADDAARASRQANQRAVMQRRTAALERSRGTLRGLPVGMGLEIVSVALQVVSLNNACSAIDNSAGDTKGIAYIEFFSASVGIASSSMTIASLSIEGVLAYRMPLTMAPGSTAAKLAQSLMHNGLILGIVVGTLDAFAAFAKASNAMKRGNNPEVARYYTVSAYCSLVSVLGTAAMAAGMLGVAVPVIGGVVALVAGTAAAVFALIAESKRTQPLENWMKRSVFGLGEPPQNLIKGFVYKWDKAEYMDAAFQALQVAWLGLWPELSVTSGTVKLRDATKSVIFGATYYIIQGVDIVCEAQLPQVKDYEKKTAFAFRMEAHISGRSEDGEDRTVLLSASQLPYDDFNGVGGRLFAYSVVDGMNFADFPSAENRPISRYDTGSMAAPAGPEIDVSPEKLGWYTGDYINAFSKKRPTIYDEFGTVTTIGSIASRVVVDTDAENIDYVSVRLRYWPDRTRPSEFAEINLGEARREWGY